MNSIKEFLDKLNSFGVPLAWIRDPITSKSSVSLTMLVISFLLVLISIIKSLNGWIGMIDATTSLSLFYASSALYFGRRLSDTKNNISIDK